MSSKRRFCPDFFIVGAPKCGTTAMYSYLRTHPGIFMPDEKEPHHFAPELSDFFVKARSAPSYGRIFADAPPGSLIGEASPMYLHSPNAVPGILAANPKAKFIAMIRNPVDMAISLHLQAIKSAHEDVAGFEDAWDLQERRARGERIPKKCRDPALLQYGSICALGDQIERLCETVRPSQRLILLLDDVRNDPHEAYGDVLKFLGLPSDDRREFPVINPTTEHMSPLLEKRLSKIRHSRNFFLGPVLYFLERINIYRLRPILRPSYKPAPPPKPEPSVYARLEREFAPQVDKLETLLGRTLGSWYRDGRPGKTSATA